MDWIPIETAPKDGTAVLLTRVGKIKGFLFGAEENERLKCKVCFWDEYEEQDDGGYWAYCYWDSAWRSVFIEPTHWMPLPTPPEE